MLNHFSHSKLAYPTADQVRLATGFGEALERLRVELDAPMLATTSAGGVQASAVIPGRGGGRDGNWTAISAAAVVKSGTDGGMGYFLEDGDREVNTHIFWVCGRGEITCFEPNQTYKPGILTYPGPCQ